MVVKLEGAIFDHDKRFESSVIPSGSKTILHIMFLSHGFESSVIPSGSKT